LTGVVGIEIPEELKIKNYWQINGKMINSENEIIIGENIASRFNKALKDQMNIFGHTFVISGILAKMGSEEDNLIFMDLHMLQKVTNSVNKINFVEVSALCSGCPIEDIVAQIKTKLPNTEINAVQKMVKQRMSAVGFVEKLATILSGVIIFIACFMLAIFMLSSVTERKKEIGILRAVWYSRSNIFTIFITEALIVGIISGFFGYIGGYYLSFEILNLLKIGETIKISFSIFENIFVVASVGIIAVLSSSLPAFKAAKITPSEALISL